MYGMGGLYIRLSSVEHREVSSRRDWVFNCLLMLSVCSFGSASGPRAPAPRPARAYPRAHHTDCARW